MITYIRDFHNKHPLRYYLIFVCKYRIPLLANAWIDADIKRLSFEICQKHGIQIRYLESDKDHIHYMIEAPVNINLADFIKTMKSYTTYHIWKIHSPYLSCRFWKEKTFWSDGYFICSVGEVSSRTLRSYIENQEK